MNLKDKEKNTGNGIIQRDLDYFKSSDVKEAILELLKKQTDAIERLKYQTIGGCDFIIARQQNIIEIKEIFGDFENE